MGRASTLSLHERGQIKALSTAGHSLKHITDVLASFSNMIMPQSTPAEAPRPSWRTMISTLWTGHRTQRT
uniref:HTH_Tnp_Tc3_1 domain-containing protein n=1 Tax=Heterorhabditis bacteriophora TaxID=37862 RepID=A0A1I7XMB5_HETBA